MIQQSSSDWQRQLVDSFRKVDELLNFLQLDKKSLPYAVDDNSSFEFLVPLAFAQLMQKGNPYDPLLIQVLPIKKELEPQPLYFTNDPLGESETNSKKGLIQKYHGRALLLISGHCAVNCRYCFRRHFPYSDNQLSKKQWRELLNDIKQDPSITELIFSGGDPLTATDKFLTWLVDEIARMGTIKRLRIHTRLPVVIPQRITQQCIQWLSHPLLNISMVLHINHANEISDDLIMATTTMHKAGVHLFNQGVLLKGVNDDVDTLQQLSFKLFDAQIIPYYMFKLDLVSGAAHFEIKDEKIAELKQQLWQRLPGYLLPRLTVELPNIEGKQLL